MEWLQLGLLVAGAYLLGAVPSGLLVGRLWGRNLLEYGSGKTGATNTMRALGRTPAAVVFVLDFVKGLLAVLAVGLFSWSTDAWLGIATGCAGAAAIVGHNWSIWVRLLAGRWGGGRGIVTAIGAMAAVNLVVVLAAALAGAVALLLTRYVVVATIVGVVGGILAAWALVASGQIAPWLLPGIVAWGLLVVIGFNDNISRLLAGTEPKLGEDTDVVNPGVEESQGEKP